MMHAILAAILTPSAFAAPTHLALGDYLDQVNGKNPTIAAGRLREEGSQLRANAASTVTAPYLFGGFSSSDDKAPYPFPVFQGTETIANGYTAGIGVNSGVGLNGKYSWNSAFSETLGTSLASGNKYTSYNKLDLTLNLGKNGFGSEISARKELTRANAAAQSLTGAYQWVSTAAAAEAAYWGLAFSRQNVQVQKDALARATKQLDWAKRRVGLQLGDRSDLLQAQASYDLHNLDYSTAVEEERKNARAFNVHRNVDGDSVPEAVAIPSLEETLKMAAPEREGERLDVQAAIERTRAAQAQSQLDKESLKPTVDVTGSYAWNSREAARSTAISNAFRDTYPTKAIGVTVSVPLNVPTWAKGIRGGSLDIEAASHDLDQTRLNEARDWNDLAAHLAEARTRLKLLGTVEGVQKEKYENERQRLLRGRTTTYQALTFEQDYAAAQLLRLRTQADVLQTIAQMKSFKGKQQ